MNLNFTLNRLFYPLLLPVVLMIGYGASAQPQGDERTTTLQVQFETADYDFSGTPKKVYLSGPIHIKTRTLTVTCDQAEVHTSRSPNPESTDNQSNIGAIDYILATGNVVLKQGNSEAQAGRMEIFPAERRLVLEDNPRMIDPYGTVSGHRIIFLEGERRIKIESGEADSRSRIQINNVEEVGFLMEEDPENDSSE